MKADITRSTFRKDKHYLKVNMQQGRVQLDSDWNEQIDINIHQNRTFLKDIIGLTGTPIDNSGFAISAEGIWKQELHIDAGHYYVEGILCENESKIEANKQPDLPNFQYPIATTNLTSWHIVYLDVWERHLTSLDDPEIREIALGGADTATRTKMLWQVKTLPVDAPSNENMGVLKCYTRSEFDKLSDAWKSTGTIKARVKPIIPTHDPCDIPSETEYRGIENQLYRVEIHNEEDAGKTATWKWSRDNGSVVAKVVEIKDNKIIVENIGKDSKLSFASGQWVEVIDDEHELIGRPGTLVQLTKVENENNTLIFDPAQSRERDDAVTAENFKLNPKVRRWDSAGLLKVEDGPKEDDGYLSLEFGIQVQFDKGKFKNGDYWLIPARTLKKDIIWPQKDENPASYPAEGIKHHYTPLALLKCVELIEKEGPSREKPKRPIKKTRTEIPIRSITQFQVTDCRVFFSALIDFIKLNYSSGDGQEAVQLKEGAFSPPFPLIASVNVGHKSIIQTPLKNTVVRFTITKGEGTLDSAKNGDERKTIDVTTDADGLAVCTSWRLDSITPDQQVKAFLLDDCNNPISPSLYFNASLPVQFYYIKGDGQEAEHEKDIDVAVGVSIGKAPLQNYKVEFSIIAGGGKMTLSDAVLTGADGIAYCKWTLGSSGEQQAKAILKDPLNNLVNLPPIYFNATFTTAKLIANSGIVSIIIPTNVSQKKVLLSAPIDHHLENIEVPPAIILALASNPGEKTPKDKAKFIEDYGLYNFGSSSVRFKAINMNLKTFAVQLEPPSYLSRTGSTVAGAWKPSEAPIQLSLRWWAIPAQTNYNQEVELLPRIVIDPVIVSTGSQFSVTVTDYNAREVETAFTLPGFEPLRFSLIRIGEGVFKLNLIIEYGQVFATIIAINPVTGERLATNSLNKNLISGKIVAAYEYDFQGQKDVVRDSAIFVAGGFCFVFFEPSKVRVNQSVQIEAGIVAKPPKGQGFTFYMSITSPGGTEQKMSPLISDSDGKISISYTPKQVGKNFTCKFEHKPEKLNGKTYEGCTSEANLDVTET